MARIVILFVLFTNFLFALVTSNVSKSIIDVGDSVEYSITAFGEKIDFPTITNINGIDIIGETTHENENFVNGKRTYMITKTFVFSPTKDTTIPPYKVIIDGKEQQTLPINIKVNQTQANNNFLLELSFDKQEMYINELVKAKITLKMDKTKPIVDIASLKLPFENFWYKDINKEKRLEDNKYNIIEKEFLLFPQKVGTISTNKASISIIINKIVEDFGFAISRPVEHKVYSNDNTLQVKPVPNNIKNVGEYEIKLSVDKRETKANEPINLTLTIEGNGNIDDINDFKLAIDNTNIFSDKPTKSYANQKDKYKATFTQKFAIVSNKDYVIKPIKFTYFSAKENTIKEITTQEIPIKVNGTIQEPPTIEKYAKQQTNLDINQTQQIVQSVSYNDKMLYFILGFVVAILLFISIVVIYKYTSLAKIKKIFHISDKEKLKILLPKIKQDKQIDEVIIKLEENVYFGKKNKIILPKILDKKENKI